MATISKIDRKLEPTIKLVDKINLIEPKHIQLKNGVNMYTTDGGEKEVLRIEIVFDAGRYFEAHPLVAGFTAKMLKEGTEKYNAKSIAESLEYYGATVKVNSDYDKTFISIYCLNRFIIPIMEVVEQIIYHPTFPEDELEKIVKRSLQKLKVNKEKVDYLASESFRYLFFGPKHPYGYKIEEENYNALNVAMLKTHFKNNFTSDKCNVFVSGKFSNEEIKIIKQSLKGIKPSTQNANPIEHFSSNNEIFKEKISKENALQAAIRIGKPVIDRQHKDYHKLNILNTILGGYFGSRLMSNIREDKGYTYGIHSFFSRMINQNYMQISTEVNVNATDDAVNEIFKEIKRLTEKEVEKDELQLVKNYLTGRLMQGVDGPFKSIDLIKGLYLNNLKTDFFHNYVNAINQVSAKEILELAQTYFQPKDFSVVIARN